MIQPGAELPQYSGLKLWFHVRSPLSRRMCPSAYLTARSFTVCGQTQRETDHPITAGGLLRRA